MKAKYSFNIALQASVDFAIGIRQAISTSGFEFSAIVSEGQNSERVCIRYASKVGAGPTKASLGCDAFIQVKICGRVCTRSANAEVVLCRILSSFLFLNLHDTFPYTEYSLRPRSSL